MQITVRAALEMMQAIGQLDGWQNGGDKLTPYKYDGATRIAIAAARRKLRAVIDDYNEARNKALMEITDGTGNLPGYMNLQGDERAAVLAKHIAFDQRDKELLAATVDLDIAPLPAARFNLDDNPIPPAVLDLLGAFIELTPPEPPADTTMYKS